MEKNKKVIYKDLFYIINEEEKTASVVKSKSRVSSINIPRYIFVNSDSYTVTSIADDAFIYSGIKSIHISENSEIRSIGNNAFFESSIEYLELPSDVSDLKEDWNNGIFFLKQIKVIEKAEKNIKLINDDKILVGKSDNKSDTFDTLYLSVRDIGDVTIPSYIKHIAGSAFQNCQIEKIKIEENSKLETIGNSAFSNMPVKYIEIPSSIVSLKKFWNSGMSDDIEFKIIKNGEENIKLVDQTFLVGKSDRKSDVFDILYYVSFPDQELTIPSYIKRIDAYSFRYCKQLLIVTFLDDSELESIGEFAFLHSQIESFIVPSHVKEICDNAFCGCENLRLITFKENSKIQSIGSEVFYNSNVECIEIPSNIKELKEDWCFETSALNRIKVIENGEENVKIINNNLLVGKSDLKSDIFDVVLFAPRDIEEATIPRNIKQIGSSAFSNCQQLRSIKFEDNSSLEKICNNAFYQSSIESIIVPSNVTEIGKYSLSSSSLHLIEFKEDSKLKIMDEGCLYQICCEEISIPSHITEISKGLFSSIQTIQKIKFQKNSELRSICRNAFLRSSVESIEIPSSVVEFKEGWCCQIDHLKEIKVIENGIENIKFCDNFLFGKTDLKSDAFNVIYLTLNKIEKAFIHNNIKKIASYAFNNCGNLRCISFEENSQLNIIEECAFYSCPISSFSLPPKVTEIGYCAFEDCDNLQIVEFSSKLSCDLFINCLSFSLNDAIFMVSCSYEDTNINHIKS